MYNALYLSKYIITKCSTDEIPISNLQLQKILFYIQKVFLKNGKRAFSDDIEAWQFGPVVPNVYYYFCGNGAMPIYSLYEQEAIHDNMIDSIVEEKRILNPWDMVNETHRPEGAWSYIYQGGAGNFRVIPVDLIKTAG